jgi:mono/diheme cytochrome c family protein
MKLRLWPFLLLLLALPLRAEPLLSLAVSSSDPEGTHEAEFAIDGQPKTRWASRSESKQPEWLQLDFGAPVPQNGLAITWEAAFAKSYEIQLSDDGVAWRTVYVQAAGKEGLEICSFPETSARYLRIYCKSYGPWPLYSIWEIEPVHPAAKAALAQVRIRLLAEKEQQRLARRVDFAKTCGFREIVYAVRKPFYDPHWYANFGYYAEGNKTYLPGGQLCKLDLGTGKNTVLIDEAEGAIRDPVLNYEATRILFAWRRGASLNFHLYEINLDGSRLKQLTTGPWDDFEPTYLPDGGIAFVSSRGRRWVNCWLTQVAIIHRCDADGGNLRPLSGNIEQDNTPWVLPDGRILYTRWEYVDRSQVSYHHLWTMNPDGTGQMVYYGNLHPSQLFIDAKPMPGSQDVLMSESPDHGQTEHWGDATLVNNLNGPDDLSARRHIPNTGGTRDPFPISKDRFLAARGGSLWAFDVKGWNTELFKLSPEQEKQGFWCSEPRPVIRREREPGIAPKIDLSQKTGRLMLTNVYEGRNMKGVKPGSIKQLLVLETLPKPINFTGGMDPLTYGGTFTLEQIIGTVPVEADGSAHFELPANRGFFLIALDGEGKAVKRMQSFLTVMPGESVSCIGCHENRTAAPPPQPRRQAFARAPSVPQPVPGVPALFDFPRDIQPILDRNCVRCHNPGKRGGGIVLTGDHGPMYSLSYYALTCRKQIADGRNLRKSNYPPYALGAVASPLMQKLDGSHHEVKVPEADRQLIRFWIESAATYPGTYAALASGVIGGYTQNQQWINNDKNWPESKAAEEAIARRCGACHAGGRRLPKNLSDERGLSPGDVDWNDPAVRPSRHAVFNLSHPEKSLILLAPLAKAAGGEGACREILADGKLGQPVVIFPDAQDPDYQKILTMLQAGEKKLAETKRFDMPGFRPRREYLREMQRFGILPPDFDLDRDPANGYELDRRYWESFHYVPGAAAPVFPMHRPAFVFACEGAKKILEFDAYGNLAWECPAEMARDVWRLPNGNTLFAYNEQYGTRSDKETASGVREVTRDKQVVFDYHCQGHVFSCQRLPDGNTLVGLAGQGKIQIVSPDGRLVREFPVKNTPGHACMRNARQLENGHVLVAEESSQNVREYAADGQLLREFPVPFLPYSAVRTPEGETIICGQQTMMRFDAAGKKTWELQGKEIPKMGIRWFSGIQLLPDGSLFVSNAGGKVPFFVVNPDKQILWRSESDNPKYPMGHGIQVLNLPGTLRK